MKKPSVNVKEISFRKTKNVNIELFTNDLRKSALCQHCPDSLHELVNLYNTTLSNTLDLHAPWPVVTKTVKSRPLVPWYSVEIKEARRERRKAERKLPRIRCCSDLLTFKVTKNMPLTLQSDPVVSFTRILYISENSSDQKKLLSLQRSC